MPVQVQSPALYPSQQRQIRRIDLYMAVQLAIEDYVDSPLIASPQDLQALQRSPPGRATLPLQMRGAGDDGLPTQHAIEVQLIGGKIRLRMPSVALHLRL